MRRKLIHTIQPAVGHERNRLRVRVFDVLDHQERSVGVGYAVVAQTREGDEHWVNVHPNEIDQLIEMLASARGVGKMADFLAGRPGSSGPVVYDPLLPGDRLLGEGDCPKKSEPVSVEDDPARPPRVAW